MFKTACDRVPGCLDGLSSQPTLSRLENAIKGRHLNGLLNGLEQSFVDELPSDTTLVVLDIDSTADETHGDQQLTFFHGFYDHHMYHPLLVFDDVTGQLVSVLLRPGNAHAARAAKPTLVRIIRRIKARFPNAQVIVRADSGFCIPRVLEAIEKLERELGNINYVFGLAKNPRLLAMARQAMEAAEQTFDATRRRVRQFSFVHYAAKTWTHDRYVIIKAEHGSRGPNPRFVLTDLDEFPPQMVYDAIYCRRGQCENLIKDFKNALSADRLSCCSYTANFFRLLLHAAAYRLMHALRTVAQQVAPELARMQFDTLRLRLLKVAAQVSQSVRRILVRLPRAFPMARGFAAVAMALGPPPPG